MLATWGTSTGRNPTLDLQFAGATSLDNRITFSRGSQATLFDSTGALVYAPNNVIRNNTMVGAVAGTPGTLPTNWTVATSQSLTTDVVAVGTSGGINYIDLRISGTPAGSPYLFSIEAINVIAAAAGQTWTESAWFALVGGSLTNVSGIQLRMRTYTSGGVFIAQSDSANLSFTSTLTRSSHNYASLPATTAFIEPALRIGLTAGQAVDFTLRIGMPQLELGSVATAVNATSGTAYYGPRFDYSPSTLAAQGLLIEEQRTNSIRNNTMQGAVAGTPGTLPTNWVQSALAAGLTANVLGTGTSSGITYIDIRISGTTADATGWSVFTDASTQIAASSGQVWTGSSYVAIIGGSTANITAGLVRVVERNSGGGYIAESNNSWTAATATLANNRFFAVRTLGGTAAFVQFGVYFQANSGVAIDITLRIGLPQLEQGAFATSVIPTTTTALTRNADVASMTGTNFSSWFNASEGVLYSQSQQYADRTGGFPVVTGVTDSGDGQNCIEHYWGNSTSSFGGIVYVSSAIQASLSTSGLTRTAVQKYAFAYKANDFASSLNGAAVSTDGSGTIPVVDRLIIGGRPTGSRYSGYIQRISYYPVRLPNSTLQALTA